MVRNRWSLVLGVFCCLSSPTWAQFDQLLSSKQMSQAKSQEELDDYIDIFYARAPQDKIQRIDAFITHYPASDFQGIVYHYLMLAYQEMGDLQGVIENGEKALKFQPDNLNTLLTLADAIPNGVSGNGPDDTRRLAQAEGYARRIFEGIELTKLPRSVPRQRWQTLSREMEASAHESLGHIASKRSDWREAITQFEKAVALNPSPRGRQFYRLGVAYMLAGNNQPAQAALHRAAELGPDEIGRMATAVLKRMAVTKNQ
jgi:tetratricopeptide (TPR) repeat protein